MDNDQFDDITIEEAATAAEARVPAREHPLYLQAEQQLREEDRVGARQSLEALKKLYPGDEAIRDLEMRLLSEPAPGIDRGTVKPGQLLRLTLTLMAVIAVCLTASALFMAAFNAIVVPTVEARETQAAIDSRWARLDDLVKADAFGEARAMLDALATDFDDPRIDEYRMELEERQARIEPYQLGLQKEDEGDWEGARDLYRQAIAPYQAGSSPEQTPEPRPAWYPDALARINRLEAKISCRDAWQEAQSLIAAGDMDAALPHLEYYDSRCPDEGNSEDVNTHLFNAYSSIGLGLLEDAGSDIGKVEQAIGYLRRALRLEPTRTDLAEQLKWAIKYVDGAKAYQRQDWERAIAEWEPVYLARPDYADGFVRSGLFDAYARAASELLSEGTGEAAPLRRAIGYVDKIPSPDPGLVEKRDLAAGYVAGLEAYEVRAWDEAIVRWGPIYDVEPDYQGGVLEEQLRTACAATDVEYETWCP